MAVNIHTSAPLTLRVDVERWPLKSPFRITGYTKVDLDVVVVTLEQRGCAGLGEAAGVYYLDDDALSMAKQIEDARVSIEAGIDRESLQKLLPPDGALVGQLCQVVDLDGPIFLKADRATRVEYADG